MPESEAADALRWIDLGYRRGLEDGRNEKRPKAKPVPDDGSSHDTAEGVFGTKDGL